MAEADEATHRTLMDMLKDWLKEQGNWDFAEPGSNMTVPRRILGALWKLGGGQASAMAGGPVGALAQGGISYDQAANFFRHTMPQLTSKVFTPGKYRAGQARRSGEGLEPLAGQFSSQGAGPTDFSSLLSYIQKLQEPSATTLGLGTSPFAPGGSLYQGTQQQQSGRVSTTKGLTPQQLQALSRLGSHFQGVGTPSQGFRFGGIGTGAGRGGVGQFDMRSLFGGGGLKGTGFGSDSGNYLF